tara:strand:- start:1325 stop:1531 length:207 start_codon:yes stop_codon:yes gene_type:complete
MVKKKLVVGQYYKVLDLGLGEFVYDNDYLGQCDIMKTHHFMFDDGQTKIFRIVLDGYEDTEVGENINV